MQPCFGGIILAAIIICLALFGFPAEWAKWSIIGAAGLFAVMSLLMGQIYARMIKKKEPAE